MLVSRCLEVDGNISLGAEFVVAAKDPNDLDGLSNDIDSLEPGTYCVLTPKKEEGSPGSLGTEKRKEAKGAGGGLFQFQEHYYVRSKEGDKCRFYLPCRPESTEVFV
ncbi:hypothetical protein D5086_006183 [Populus alba]|uniref:Uncharacterized protein n=1 Tax=Populus alba TaxID=43335 RepID=A0ACC4CJS7_POPAL